MVVLYVGLVALTGWRVLDTPRGFIPVQDQDNVAISITMPPGTSLARTDAIVQQVVPIVLDTPGVRIRSVYSGMDGITLQQRHQFRPDLGDLRAVRGAPAQGPDGAGDRRRTAQAPRRDHGGRHPHHDCRRRCAAWGRRAASA